MSYGALRVKLNYIDVERRVALPPTSHVDTVRQHNHTMMRLQTRRLHSTQICVNIIRAGEIRICKQHQHNMNDE